jgi:hypothetical protein
MLRHGVRKTKRESAECFQRSVYRVDTDLGMSLPVLCNGMDWHNSLLSSVRADMAPFPSPSLNTSCHLYLPVQEETAMVLDQLVVLQYLYRPHPFPQLADVQMLNDDVYFTLLLGAIFFMSKVVNEIRESLNT